MATVVPSSLMTPQMKVVLSPLSLMHAASDQNDGLRNTHGASKLKEAFM